LREDAVKRAVGSAAIAAAAASLCGMAACTRDTTPGGGVVVSVSLDRSLDGVPLTAFRVTAGASLDDGGPTYFDGGFAVTDGAASPHDVRFPTTFAIDSNGDPGAAVAIDVSIWNEAQQVERQRFLVDQIPTTTIGDLTVVFGSACGASGPYAGEQPATCPLLSWCEWKGSYWECNGALLPAPGTDAGWPERGADATTDAGADVAVEAEADAGVSDSSGDRTVGDADAGPDGETGDAPADAADAETDATDAPLTVPCDAPCGAGQTCVDGECVAGPPSCAGGGPGAGPNCGLAGNDDCCASDEVGAGGFFREYDGHAYRDMSWPASVSRFRLDRYEVTVGRFRAFVADVVARGWVPPPAAGRHTYLSGDAGLNNGGDGTVPEPGWLESWNTYVPQTKADWDGQLLSCPEDDAGLDYRTWTMTATTSNENLPLDCVNWYQAYAFCIWDGGFLPSDAEWDYAAAGGNNEWTYPWGDWDPGASAMYAIYNCFYPQMLQGNDCQGLANVAPVGSAPAGRALWGQLDLAGSVFEWTLDYSNASASLPLPCHDCAQTVGGTERVIHGGSYHSNETELPSAVRKQNFPELPRTDFGFRCARAP
jgi:formylglycine-generating enzyme required for sulfatase activity